MPDMIYEVLYYVYILVFGVYVSMRLACGRLSARNWQIFAWLCLALLVMQGVCLQFLGIDRVWALYPLITHLPMLLTLIWLLKQQWGRALVSVVISYSLCQLPRWAGLVFQACGLTPAVELALHLAASQAILMLLDKFCLDAVHGLLSSFRAPLRYIGVLPVTYYLYEYFMLYTKRRYSHVLALNEFLPTGLVLFFILFAIAYQRETEKRALAERQSAALEMKLSHAEREIHLLRAIEEQTAIYRHDLRHHLAMLDSLLSTGREEQAAAYIREVQSEIGAITPIRCCENETVNLLLGAFRDRAEAQGVNLMIKASLPAELSLPDTELCALFSNGLENAANAVARLPEGEKRIDLYCGIKQGKLLIEIRNPYAGEILMEDGLPRTDASSHGYGCRSIRSIALRRQGMCSFDAAQGMFTLRVVIPLV